jgi:mycothiol synthase
MVELRPAIVDDLHAIAELQRRHEVHWFGASEHSVDEVAEFLSYADPLTENSLLVVDGGGLAAVALRFGTDTVLTVDPDADTAAVYGLVLPWFAERPGHTDVLSRDEQAITVVEAAGWTYYKSAYDLIADVTPDLRLAEPEWPSGVEVRDFDLSDVAAIHRLIYVDAGWAEVPGHPERGFDEWRRIFITEHTVPEQQVIAWRGDRVVGVAIGRTWDDGTGWIAQLATAKDERGCGLGRAMLLEAMRRRIAGGATSLGLGVQATNERALNLYLQAGLKIDREFRTYKAPAKRS